MAANAISSTEINRDASISRVNARQAEESQERAVVAVAKQESKQELRTKSAVETQIGRNVDIRV